jgi:hypothetical protein
VGTELRRGRHRRQCKCAEASQLVNSCSRISHHQAERTRWCLRRSGYAFDTVKVRLQNSPVDTYRSAWHCFTNILRYEGVSAPTVAAFVDECCSASAQAHCQLPSSSPAPAHLRCAGIQSLPRRGSAARGRGAGDRDQLLGARPLGRPWTARAGATPRHPAPPAPARGPARRCECRRDSALLAPPASQVYTHMLHRLNVRPARTRRACLHPKWLPPCTLSSAWPPPGGRAVPGPGHGGGVGGDGGLRPERPPVAVRAGQGAAPPARPRLCRARGAQQARAFAGRVCMRAPARGKQRGAAPGGLQPAGARRLRRRARVSARGRSAACRSAGRARSAAARPRPPRTRARRRASATCSRRRV